MQLRIVHATSLSYAAKANASYYLARLTPRSSSEQIVVTTRLEVTPTPFTYTYRDYFGASVTAFEVLDPHDELTVTATTTVHTQRRAAGPAGLPWESMATRQVADRYSEFLDVGEIVGPPDDLVGRLDPLRSSGDRPGDTARAVCALLHEQVEHVDGRTQPRAAQAWQRRAGTAQDLAHLTLGCLRTLGIPARYVTGYHHPDPGAAVGTDVPGRQHAWVEWWDDGWCGHDPSHDRAPGDTYVVVAAGRDEGDVPPLKGIYSGAAAPERSTEVRLTRLA